MYGIYANIGGILMGSMAHHIYNYQYIYIAAPLGSVMGNLQKETLIFPFLALEKSQAVGETPGFSHPFSPMDWHRLKTPRIHGIYADGWRKGRLCRQDRRLRWVGFVRFGIGLESTRSTRPTKKATLRESGKIAKICKGIPSGYLT